MDGIDLVVLIAVVAASVACAVVMRRRGARGVTFAAAMAAGFYGIVLTIAMTAHMLDILTRWYIGRGYDGTPLGYDFRLYSLMLLGALLTTLGVRLVRSALWLASAEPDGRRTVFVAAGLATLVVLPLIPIQTFFAVPLSVLGTLVLLVTAASSVPASRSSGSPRRT